MVKIIGEWLEKILNMLVEKWFILKNNEFLVNR